MKRTLISALLSVTLFSANAKDVNVADFGAVCDGSVLTTAQLQKAIDECANTGGGKVTVPPGKYLTGQLWLRSHVELYLSRGCTLLGSTDRYNDYVKTNLEKCMVIADGIEDAGISGEGTLDGQSETEAFRAYGILDNANDRPFMILYKDSKNLSLRGVKVINSQFWSVKLFRCDGLIVDGITIRCHGTFNNDGLDIDSRNVSISNCILDTDDDAVCFKSDDPNFLPENISVTNCVIASNCNPIKFGTASFAGFRNITISNCTIHPTSVSKVRHWDKEYKGVKEGTHTGLSGIIIEAVDGGTVEHIRISNISMCGVITPIAIVLNHRHGNATMRDISINNVTAVCESFLPCIISGIPGDYIEDITLRDIVMENDGGQKPMEGKLPENLNGYPENRMYGYDNPASALYVRHAKNVTIENFQARTRNRDFRPAVVLEDVSGFDGNKIVSNGKRWY